MKIGYQGMEGSNAEAAAKVMASQLGYKEVKYIPLISSQKVVEALVSGAIDEGVMAIQNTLGGIVEETAKVLKTVQVTPCAEVVLPIHHCLFKKHEKIKLSQLQKVASHCQALKQTEKSRAKRYPDLIEEAIEDTAIGAKWLAEGKLGEEVAVICRRNAGEAFGLSLIEANIEDDPSNQTQFKMFQLS